MRMLKPAGFVLFLALLGLGTTACTSPLDSWIPPDHNEEGQPEDDEESEAFNVSFGGAVFV